MSSLDTQDRELQLSNPTPVFSFKPQTQQGADILANWLNVQILMPDFFEDGSAWLLEQYPPTTDEQKANIQKFFGGIADPPANAKKLFNFGASLRNDGVKKIGCYGFCWGKHLRDFWFRFVDVCLPMSHAR